MIIESPELADVISDGYVSGTISVTTSEIEAKVGVSPLTGREILTIYNGGNKTIFYGPTGVTIMTGIPIFKDQVVSLPIGQSLSIFLITYSGTQTARIQEFA